MADAAHAVPLVEIATVIVGAVALGLMFMRLRQPPLVGFIIAGVVLGPTGLGVIDSNANVAALAEMGVLVLLFFIGMELSLKAFVATLKPAIIVAVGQLVSAMVIGFGISWMTGAGLAEAIILGFIIALSSTVVAMKMLEDMGALRKEPGRVAVGVLIAQDIAVVPMLILVGALGGEAVDPVSILLKIGFAVFFLGGLLWWLGRRPKIKVPFSDVIEDNVDLLSLGAMGGCFAAAAASGVFGLSPAYGAFIAGLVIGNSTLRNKVIPVVEPIQSVLLVVFFLSIGLLIDLSYIWANLSLVMTAAFFVVIVKTLVNILLLRFTGYDRDTALVAGLSMAQIGEFSFVIAAAGLAANALGDDLYRLSIAVIAVTLLVSPLWIAIMHRIDEAANENYASYSEALLEAYGDELEGVEEQWWWLKVRLRAGRIARHKRREAKAEAKQKAKDDKLLKAQVKAEAKAEQNKAPEPAKSAAPTADEVSKA